MKHQNEFDEFVEDYRNKQNHELWATGEDSAFFAKYKVFKLAGWLPELLNLKNKILDFGCGDGLMSNYLSYYFNNSTIVGVDISEESVNQAQATFPKLSFKKIENNICLETSVFDIVVAAGVFHHIPENEHIFWVKELLRVLKPGGKLIVFELNPLNPGTQWIFRNHPMEKNAKMLFPWYAKKIFVNNSLKLEVKFFCFFPGWLSFFRSLEPYLEKIPLGGLYSIIITKPY